MPGTDKKSLIETNDEITGSYPQTIAVLPMQVENEHALLSSCHGHLRRYVIGLASGSRRTGETCQGCKFLAAIHCSKNAN